MENLTTNWAHVISSNKPRMLAKDANGVWSTIGITGNKNISNFDSTTSIKTNKDPGVIFLPQAAEQLTGSCNLEIPIPDPVNHDMTTMPILFESKIKLFYAQINAIRSLAENQNEIYIEYPHNNKSYLVRVLPNKKEENNKSILLSPSKSQDNASPSVATKENPIFHIVSQGIFYKVNNNFTLDNADYYLSGQSCKKTLLLDPSQEISNPIEHDEVLIPLGILKRLQQELIKQDKIDLYVNEGNNDEIKIITIKQPVKEPIQQPAPKAFFAAYPRLTILLISIGITGLAYLTVCFIARAWNKTTSTYYINASLY